MATEPTAVRAKDVERAIAAAVRDSPRLLLAVSGGRDSMVLMHAVARAASAREQVVVASFDHGTGPAATGAVALVARQAGASGLACVIGRAGRKLRGEAAWREARWGFLQEVAAREKARIATAHSRDDQLETVVIRVLRDAGARGLAGLYTKSEIARPLLELGREEIAAYADEYAVEYVEDPSNVSRRYLRNRVRLDLLPAIARVHPQFAAEMLAVSRRAVRWREEVEAVIDKLEIERLAPGVIRVASESLHGYDAASLAVLWPAIAARAGVTMDRRGTLRAAAFTIDAGVRQRDRRRGRVIQLAGGAEIARVGSGFILRRR